MNQNIEQLGFDPDIEYRAIEAALLETARGRWFLSEHGRRARRLDGTALEEAMQRLNNSLRQPPALLGTLQREVENLLADIEDARAANQSKVQKPEGTETSNPQAILKAAEDLHELAWQLQAQEVDTANCEAIARTVGRIYTMSLLQGQESQRARLFAETLDGLGGRLSALLQTISYEMSGDGPAAAPLETSRAAIAARS